MSAVKPLPNERRGFGRRETFIRGVLIASGRSQVKCRMVNYSEGGALLELDEPAVPPNRFHFVVESKSIDILCEVRHVNGRQVGVTFIGNGAARLFRQRKQPKYLRPVVINRKQVYVERTTGTDLRSQMFGDREDDDK